jgi:hypothetical protein
MALTYVTGKNNYTTMRDLGQWIQSLNLPNIHFMNSAMTDDLTIVNTYNKNSQRITRYALEDAADPHEVILEAISNIMAVPIDKLGDIIREAANPKPMTYTTDNTSSSWSDGIYDYNPDGTVKRVSQNIFPTHPISGAIGAPLNPIPANQYMHNQMNTLKTFVDYAGTGHVGYTPLTDEEIMIRDKTFGPYERDLITTAKEKLKQKYWLYIPSELMYSKHIVIAGG